MKRHLFDDKAKWSLNISSSGGVSVFGFWRGAIWGHLVHPGLGEAPFASHAPILSELISHPLGNGATCVGRRGAAGRMHTGTLPKPKGQSRSQGASFGGEDLEYYSAVRKNEMMPFSATWLDLEIIILSEVSRTENEKYPITSLIEGI